MIGSGLPRFKPQGAMLLGVYIITIQGDASATLSAGRSATCFLGRVGGLAGARSGGEAISGDNIQALIRYN